MFAELRNKTRGHGALTPATCAKLAEGLQRSIQEIIENNPIFELPWAYLHRNLSGKYRVVPLGGDQSVFDNLKTSSSISANENLQNGVYVYTSRYRRVELLHTDLDVADYFFPNGAFRGSSYELHSLITDSRHKGDAAPYLAPATERPRSETEGRAELDVQGRVFANLPATTVGYVPRPRLESAITSALLNDRHPIVTLVGRGGIGKTSVALTVLREIASNDRFDVIVWFSARDIDLIMSGAKPVRPHVLTDRDIAEEYRALVNGLIEAQTDRTSPTDFMAAHMRNSPLGPTLFVFDNFETVRSPIDLFAWIDTNIRIPNKALITSRFRDFKADYPVEVLGMEHEEAEALVKQTALSLGIEPLIGRKEIDTIIEESNGHPYVIKIMLGEIANAGKFSKPSHVFARKDDILDALFERTYANISPLAAQIFLTLSGWRSLVPQLAIEAVVLRHNSAGVDPESAIDELVRMSLVERIAAGDGNVFLEVPLAAALFGRRKLKVSPAQAIVEGDIQFLQEIGVTTKSGLKEGIRPRIKTFFARVARSINTGAKTVEEFRPVLEFLARGHPRAWIDLAELEEEVSGRAGLQRAAEYVRRYLETDPSQIEAELGWRKLIFLYRSIGDVIAGCNAFLKAAEVNEPPINEVSEMANWLNNSPESKQNIDVIDRKSIFQPLARLMEMHIADASATDLSRLAWLHLHSGEETRALEVAELGLEKESDNIHCLRLVAKLRDTW